MFCQYCQLVTGYQLFLIINMSVAYAGYVETNTETLTSALYDSLSYKRQPNFVFFKEAVHHAARLSRVLVVVLLFAVEVFISTPINLHNSLIARFSLCVYTVQTRNCSVTCTKLLLFCSVQLCRLQFA